ncbi:uncharacterized protein NPIL_178451 [Nephila pilipes]|uniref:Uncharacterized protein n=1 Tax=Nephila pilipes TaxID=299642 RepID=A0A8X6II42_NEPPI|nr:uncharacterized protein NPIL_178451 [Nephila pilipes]
MEIPQFLTLADKSFSVHALISADIFCKVLKQNTYKVNEELFFKDSEFGWIACATIKQHIEKYKHEFPDIVELLDRSFNVDDLISGGNEFEEALQTSRRAKYIMEAAGMDLRKWITNDANLMEQWKREKFDVHPVHETVS